MAPRLGWFIRRGAKSERASLLGRTSQAKQIYIFDGAGVCPGCAEGVAATLESLHLDINFVREGQLTKAMFDDAALYVQPGGSDRVQDTTDALNKWEFNNLRAYVREGGHYLGICAGAYLAGLWADDHKKVPAFRLLPTAIDQELPGTKARMVTINWLGLQREVYYQAGPYFDASAIPQARILATYQSTGRVAALTAPMGAGDVTVIGPHREADQKWLDDDNLTDPDGSDDFLLAAFLPKLLEDAPNVTTLHDGDGIVRPDTPKDAAARDIRPSLPGTGSNGFSLH